jgi:hypothetical protein
MSLVVVLSTTFGLVTATLADSAASPGTPSLPPTLENVSPNAEAGREYWTPERLRNARPVEMYPAGPPEEGEFDIPRQPGSVGEPGRPGSGDIAPDETNFILPMDGGSDVEPGSGE